MTDWLLLAEKTQALLAAAKSIPCPAGWDIDIWFENYPPRINAYLGKINTDKRRAESHKGYIVQYTDAELSELTEFSTAIAMLGLSKCKSHIDDGIVKYKFWIMP